jgi:hypothetical protein
MIILRQKQYTRAEKEAMFQLMRLTKGFKSLPKELNSVENAKRFKKFSNRLVKFANDPETHKLSAEELKEMKGFLSDIGATKFADNFEPIINKYYGNNNIEAWKRLSLKEDSLPTEALVSRYNRLVRRHRGNLDTYKEANEFNNNLKSTKGKSNKEIFSSPEGKLMKKIIKGETGGVGQPSIYFNNVKDRNKLVNFVNNAAKKNNLTKDEIKELLRKERVTLRGHENFATPAGNNNYGSVYISDANPSTLSHELGHTKSIADSIAAGTSHGESISSSKKLSAPLRKTSANRLGAMYLRLNSLSTIAEENMANAYGRDIIRKYGGKNVDKYLADYEKMVDNKNMKSYLSGAIRNDVDKNINITNDILDWRGIQ